MPKRIFKYKVPLDTFVSMDMPEGAEPLHFGIQNDEPTLWAKVDPDNPIVSKKFMLFSTGYWFEDDHLKYIGTVINLDRYVWHLFEVT